jgi:phospholipid/cholesterol/gamma-HCH transport system substrate-binding protein
MPQQTKAKWAKLKVGVMTIVALVILGVLVFLLTGSQRPFASRTTVYTFMEDSAALTENSAVRLNGIVVGKVSRIALSGSSDPRRIVKMNLEIEDRFLGEIPIDSMAGIGAENVLGTKYINIKKGVSPTTVKPGGEIAARDTSDFNDVIEQGNTLLVQLQTILGRVDAVVGQIEVGKGSIGKLLVDEELYNRLVATVAQVQQIAATLNTDKGTIGKLVHSDELYTDIRTSLARFDNILDGLQQGQGTAGRILKDPALYQETQRAVADLRRILSDVDAGKGTVGKLLKSDELHNQIASTLTTVDTMLNKVNSGQGTMGQLLVNQSLYDSINGTTRELNGLLQDFRANPRKFLRIKLALF